MGYYHDALYVLVIIVFIMSLAAQIKVNVTFNKYSKIKNEKNFTGYAAAMQILEANRIDDVKIECVDGKLSDHYDPAKNIVRLSNEVYNGTSVASIGVAAHEIGHVLQYKQSYSLISLRTAIFPVVSLGSNLAMPLFILGIIFSIKFLMLVGILFFLFVAVFQFITLPTEFNASARALEALKEEKILFDSEILDAKKVLTAAALTYIAALITTLVQLLRLIFAYSKKD